MKKISLRPCPFCGNKDIRITDTDDERNDLAVDVQYFAICSIWRNGCGAASGYKETKEAAAEAWNRRAE